MATERLDIHKTDPASTKAMLALESYVHSGNVEPALLELVKIRASQINGCARCLDLHCTDALKAGESERRINLLAAWREAGAVFSAREQAALDLTESVTLISKQGVPDDVWNQVVEQFDDGDIVTLLMAINAINAWNRLAVAVHRPLPS